MATGTRWTTEDFEEHRGHLRGVAYRMLGSMAEADDAVQEAWLRLERSGSDDIENLRAWLTTVVSRSWEVTVPASCGTGMHGQRTFHVDLGAGWPVDEAAGLGTSHLYGRTMTFALVPL